MAQSWEKCIADRRAELTVWRIVIFVIEGTLGSFSSLPSFNVHGDGCCATKLRFDRCGRNFQQATFLQSHEKRPLAGSSTTLLAAMLEERRAIGLEREEPYCEISAKRLERLIDGSDCVAA